jgi:hypothetical protein
LTWLAHQDARAKTWVDTSDQNRQLGIGGGQLTLVETSVVVVVVVVGAGIGGLEDARNGRGI